MDRLSFLIEHEVISEAQAEEVRAAITNAGISEEQALLDMGLEKSVVREQIAEYYQVPSYELPEGVRLAEGVLGYIPEESARHYRVVPLKIEDDVLLVGSNNPDDLQVREVLNYISTKHNLPYKLHFMLDSDIEAAHTFYENLSGEVGEALTTLENDLDAEIARRAEEEKDLPKEDLDHIKEDAPVTRIVATILRYAVDGGASDIHVEPTGGKIKVRFRVDGSLATSLELPKKTHSAVVARIKILSSMRLDERRKPQDGRFSATFDERKIDFRVSVLPTNHGEKVVMRILDNEKGVTTLEDTGIGGHHLEVIRRMIKEPYGIMLISGPTGSGKSTTLYAMLSEVDRATKNVLSLEDPVEYNIDGVSQSQVRPEIGYTFAHGLRAALRQDPDIIMVGEIRDKETAQLAIQAALTGHLVLSTIHTNNSIGVIPRLIDMGVDPYLIAPTLKLAIAQRLAKRLCEGTGREEKINKAIEVMMQKEFSTLPDKFKGAIPKADTIMHPEPSPQCATGLKGRIAIMEVLEIDERIQEMILSNAAEEDIFLSARENGFMTMKEDAIIKALEHKIPYEEMNAFGTKVGLENVTDDVTAPVDNQTETSPLSDV
ncbi:MAG: ATPase, T2SS/T4P/T4SS family [Patescibacteria group bacterium]